MNGNKVRWMKTTWPRGKSLPSWRIASKNGRPSMSPTVPPISTSTKSTFVALQHEFLDRIGDMGNDLHRRPKEIAAPLLGDDFLIDTAGGDVVVLVRGAAGEALVMTEV